MAHGPGMQPEGTASEPRMALQAKDFSVLGAGGFIGTNLCHALRCEANSVRGLFRSGSSAAAMPGVQPVVGDFADEDKVRELVAGSDIVFHLIGTTTPATGNRDMAGEILDNVVRTIRFLDICVEEGVTRIIYASSGGTVYGIPTVIPTPETAATRPITSYGISKLSVEMYLELYRYHFGLDYRVLRLSNPYGPYQIEKNEHGVVSAFLRRAISGKPVQVWGDGSVARDFVYIDDVVDAMIRAAEHTGKTRTMNIGSGAATSIVDLIEAIGKALGRSVEYVQLDARAVDVARSSLDITRAREELGWRPTTTLRTGLEKTISWIQRGPQTADLVSNVNKTMLPKGQQEDKK